MPLIFNDIMEVVTITASFPHVAVLGYPTPHIIVSQIAIAASRRCYFTSGSHCPIIGLITDRRLPLRVVGRFLCYHEVCYLSPLMCQCNKGRTFRCHVQNHLGDGLEPHGIEFWIQILDHYNIGCLGIGCLRSPNCGISAGAIV
jgi:hypothetical protein